MSGRYRTVALQAVSVAALAAVIFVVFLRPSDPGELSGIDAPGGGDKPIAVSPTDDDEKKQNSKTTGEVKDRPGGGNASNGPRANGSGAAGPDDTPAPPDGDGGPPDEQYTDPVSVLMEKVGEPKLFEEINEP